MFYFSYLGLFSSLWFFFLFHNFKKKGHVYLDSVMSKDFLLNRRRRRKKKMRLMFYSTVIRCSFHGKLLRSIEPMFPCHVQTNDRYFQFGNNRSPLFYLDKSIDLETSSSQWMNFSLRCFLVFTFLAQFVVKSFEMKRSRRIVVRRDDVRLILVFD